MAYLDTTELYQWTVFINHGPNGWSESYYLRDSTREGALATAAELLEARSWLLGANTEIIWAEIKHLQPPRNIQAAIGDVVEPLPIWEPPHDDGVGLLFRFQTGQGKFANHLVRGVADDEISDNRWMREGMTFPAGLAPRPLVPELADKADLWRYWLTLFRDRTCHAEYLGYEPGVGDVWRKRKWNDVLFNRVSARRMSSRYDRMSAEWADWEHAADFSFCGAACTVQRTCRVVDAYPYTDGPVNHLRFYFAAEGAAVYPHPHIFWGTYRDQDYEPVDHVGEVKGRRRSLAYPSGVWEYSIGTSWGDAPGLAWTGPPSRFLGLDPIPFDPYPDTPIEYRPECDEMVFSFTFDDARPNTLTINNCRRVSLERSKFILTLTEGSEHEGTVDLASLQERGELAVLFAHRSAFA